MMSDTFSFLYITGNCDEFHVLRTWRPHEYRAKILLMILKDASSYHLQLRKVSVFYAINVCVVY